MAQLQFTRGRTKRHASVPVALLLVFATSVFLVDSGGGVRSAMAAAETAGSSPTPPVAENDLPTIPPVPKLEPAPPDRADIDDIDARLHRLQADSFEDRKEAFREVLEVRPRLVGAVLLRLDKLAARADRERMKRALTQVHERSEVVTRGQAESRPDLLMQLLEKARLKDDGWSDLVELVALSRMLTQIGNVQAARGLIEIYVRFGEFMRVDVQNRLLDLKDGAVPALIEARRHRAEKVAHWAERQLDRLGKGVPNEAIRTDSFEVLADVLRAYGRTKDPDAARIIVSYANSERFQLREAARQAIAMLGEVGIWQLRDAYESVVGKRPRRDWSWERTARELFFEYDRLHAAKAYDLLQVGNKAADEGRFDDMAKAYDALLARLPQFDKAATIAPKYFAWAEKVAQSNPAAAQAALVRVERLATDSALRQRARSLRDTIRADEQRQQGVVDTYLLSRAIERDPSNRRAKELLTSGDRAKVEALTHRTRWLTSGVIAAVAAAAILLIWLRRGNSSARSAPRTASKSTPPDNATGAAAALESSAPVNQEQAGAAHPAPPGALAVTLPRELTDLDDSHPASGADTATAVQSATGSDGPLTTEPPARRKDPFEDL